ncbi:MAG: ATP-binding protein [Sphingobacteriia bacterium]|nr:ATP-binding protein [Sphingobacteriia bacterium]NCC38653.1 ATP-binding protein [Gammaproteobacteria bacterium]
MSIQSFCTPRPSVYAADRRATVLNLDTFLKGQVDGAAFFEENYFTNGMLTLVDRAFRHLGGQGAGSSVFLLSQAMGGGKTHSMIALGLLARDPLLRDRVLEHNPAPALGACRVAGFNGRSTDAPGGIWGSLAEQLGKADQFARYVSPLLSAPGPEAWKQLLGDEPLVLFLDELPPYLEYAVTVPVGNADLSVVTTAALANLFVAVADMGNVCLVLSDLAGSSFGIGQSALEAAFNRAVHGITSESKRIAVPITPVNPNGDELYHILRKRLFERVAPQSNIAAVAAAYREALREAVKMGLTTSSPETLYTRVIDAYPFHPDLRELVGRFKENEGFQQTRGVIRLMQMVVSSLWSSGHAANIDLIHPYDLDLNLDEIASEIRTINPSLSEAIAHDIARGGDAEVEQIDADNGNTDTSDAARLILVASLSTTPGAIQGLREYQLIDCLQRPGRDLSTFKVNVLDKLATRAWYLHDSADGRLFFKNQQNLAAKLRSTALSLHTETVERMLREHLESYFSASLRDCYQVIKVLPPPDEVQIEQDKTTLVIVRPGGQASQLPISADWQAWWNQQPYKNRVLFLTGSRDTFQKVLDGARQMRALHSIDDELKSENTPANDPQWRALDVLRDRMGLQFTAALKEAFDQIVYPSINTALRATGIDLAFAGNQNGEATIRKTLEGAQKFTTKIDDDSFRIRAEARLFGSTDTKVVLWSDFKRAAAVNTNWPLHKLSALDDLKADCVRRDLWREEGNHLRRGPFPPPVPEVSIRELSVQDEGDGYTYLKIEPLHAPAVVYETGDAEPTAASSPVPTPTRFEATGLSYRFLAVDPNDCARLSVVKDWTAKLRLKYQLHHRGDHDEVELQALPRAGGIVIRYTTDGTAPTSTAAATYNGVFRVPANCRVVCAIAVADAYDLTSETLRIPIPQPGETRLRPAIDLMQPARWTQQTKLDDAGAVWDVIQRLEQASGVRAHDISLTAESRDGQQTVDYFGALDGGYDGVAVKSVVEQLQNLVGGDSLRMIVGSLAFPTGQALLDWLRATQQPFDETKITQ